MSRAALSIAVVPVCFRRQPGRFPRPRPAVPADGTVPVPWAPVSVCALAQDPWQDCEEDPWQPSWRGPRADDHFSDPWQDRADPWQPVFAATRSVAAATDGVEDPWQPAFADPWQDGGEDPWQLP